METLIRTYLARLVGVAVGALATWLETKYGITISADTQGHLNALGIAVAVGAGQLGYVLAHRAVSKRTNPGDAASSHLAADEAEKTKQLKRAAGL